ncbi:uncharacterized protein LOC142240336 [Haematobia irritans]|uniref:uncharacterized protein LOC142240336 n=1 Tax=Haematobia irritans TaxID=7368 RepID=UPI003F50AB3E
MERANQRSRDIRKYFIFKTYFLFVILILLSAAECISLKKFDSLSKFIFDHVELAVTCFFMALMLLTIFVFVENVRFVAPLNWLLALFIVQGFISGVARTIAYISLEELSICFAYVTILMTVCILFASCLSHDFTLDVIIIFVLSFIFFIAAVYFVTLFAVAKVDFSFYIFNGLVTFIVCIFIFYHTQTVNGGRYAELRLADYILASIILYCDFTVLLLLSLYSVPKVWSCLKQAS